MPGSRGWERAARGLAGQLGACETLWSWSGGWSRETWGCTQGGHGKEVLVVQVSVWLSQLGLAPVTGVTVEGVAGD